MRSDMGGGGKGGSAHAAAEIDIAASEGEEAKGDSEKEEIVHDQGKEE
jgi:hypothetical protein